MAFNLGKIIPVIISIIGKFTKKKDQKEWSPPETGVTNSANAADPKLQTSIGLETKTITATEPKYTEASPEIAEAIKNSVPVSEEEALGPFIPAVNPNKDLISAEQLRSISGCDAVTANKYVVQLNESMKRFGIVNALQIVHFLAQVMHESGSFRYTKELASGAAYEGRKDLGNTEAGDGIKFKGRGFIQITGRANYQKLGASLKMNLTEGDNPKLLEGPELAALSAAWFWDYKKDKFGKNLNDFALLDDVIKITYFVNGGFNGLQDRLKYLKKAYRVMGFKDTADRMERIFDEIEANINAKERPTNKMKALFAAVPSHKNLAEMKAALDRV